MRAFNVAMCFVVSALLALGLFEVGLRVLGKGPTPTINQFDPVTGWSKRPNVKTERKTSEFHVTTEINALGLRDDPMDSPAKPAGSYRVIALGDSFVQGYTVDRDELFVDLLESWWRSEGRNVDVVNAGTEGWSTDQEVAWFEANAARFQPDLVLLFPYENDLYWNGQSQYRRFPKPRYHPFGNREPAVLVDPGPRPWFENTAVGSLCAALGERPLSWAVSDSRRRLDMESAAFFVDPPEFMKEAIGRTRGALVALKAACEAHGAKLVVVPIPGKAAIDGSARAVLAARLNPSTIGERLKFWDKPVQLDPATWSPDQPVETFLALARQLGLPAFDARDALRESAKDGVERARIIPAEFAAKTAVPPPAEPADDSLPRWPFVFAALWLALSSGFAFTYRDTPWWKAALGVGAMLGAVFAIALGGGALLRLLPARLSTLFLVLVLATLFGFIAYKLGRRIGTIAELFKAFTLRGHWYLMPLVVVLLTVGSLLVVAASSPLIAPFIYTLF